MTGGRSVVLNNPMLDTTSRERIRQLALWSPEPILLNYNCGLPIRHREEVAKELDSFQREGVVRFWKYAQEPSFRESASVLTVVPPVEIDARSYRKLAGFVDARLEQHMPDLRELGFRSVEGMLLEQVVLRRRFFSQGIAGVLNASALADSPGHIEALYTGQLQLFSQVNDVVADFFSAVYLPPLTVLESDGFLELRERSRLVLPDLMADVIGQLAVGEDDQTKRASVVARLIARYRAELIQLLKTLPRSSNSRESMDQYANGTVAEIEGRLALFQLGESIAELGDWFRRQTDGRCELALLLLEWKTGVREGG